MSEPVTFSSVTLEAEHKPETHYTREANGAVSEQELPGEVWLYAVFDGGRVLLDRFSAGRVLEAVETAKNAEQTEASESDSTKPASTT